MKNLTLIITLLVCAFNANAQLDTVRLMFNTNKYEITPSHTKAIDSLLNIKGQITRIKVAGHTDNVGSDAFNQKLSEKRAASVYNYLKAHGIDTALLFVKFYGSTDPRVANTNSENQAANRRVDIVSAFVDTESIAKPQAPPPPKQFHLTFSNGVKMNFIEGDYDKSSENYLVSSDVSKGAGSLGTPPITLITNTTEMRAANMLTMTADNEVLVSQIICCFSREACGSAKPVETLIPVAKPYHCDLSKVAMWEQQLDENGRTKWTLSQAQFDVVQLENLTYLRFKRIPPCGCVNFDFKLHVGCGVIDSFNLEVRKNAKKPKLFTKVVIRKVEVEDTVANMLYEPVAASTNQFKIQVMEDSKTNARVSVRLIGKKNTSYRINAVPLRAFNYDKATNTYFVTKKGLKVYKK
ncbi:MAG: OmpA family protein [Chitinophagales bacterium]